MDPVIRTAGAPAAAQTTTPGAARTDRARAWLRAVAIAACLPYLTLKTAWLTGSRVGIPEGSVLLDHPTATAVANAVTVLMDGSVIVLALLLTRPWGARVRPWLLTVPMWTATGLLAPIMTGYPLQLAAGLFGTSQGTAADRAETFLDAWVFAVVYGGFILQGLALGALFLLYTRDRWGVLWQGTVGGLPDSAATKGVRCCAVLGAVAAVFPAAVHLAWAGGARTGLGASGPADFRLLEGLRAAFAVVAVVCALVLAFRAAPRLRLGPVLAGSWVATAAWTAWGGWMLIGSLLPADGESRTAVVTLTYAVGMISGLLLSAVTVTVLTRRPA
ncbi:hypothetical protein [Streptomyces sp. NPDC005805]|uniref:hypothetical protein n=1 Tax=Streptomyces sp. NPDC005805 TaxID=3157068 RepID=UPI0033DE3533